MCKNDIFVWNKDRLKLGSGFKVQGSGFRVQGSGLAPGAYCPLIPFESFTWMRNGGAVPDPSTQFSLFRLYMIEHPTFHSAQDDEMRREA